jgi:hypothetical protein
MRYRKSTSTPADIFYQGAGIFPKGPANSPKSSLFSAAPGLHSCIGVENSERAVDEQLDETGNIGDDDFYIRFREALRRSNLLFADHLPFRALWSGPVGNG